MPQPDYLILDAEIVSQEKKTFLLPSADKQTNNYDTECSNHDLSQSQKHIVVELQQGKMMSYIYIHTHTYIYILYTHIYYIYVNLRRNSQIFHSRSGVSQYQQTFLAPSAYKPTRNCDTEHSHHRPFQSLKVFIFLFF